jgi:ethanolamine utilization protein EutM
MAYKALGLIETKGLVGAIEATDAAAKAAAVVVSSVELTEAAYLTIKIEGELGAVQAAVQAGATAAEKIGELVSVHVIPNPDDGLGKILLPRRYISKYHPEDSRPLYDPEGFEPDMPISKKTPKRKTKPTKRKPTAKTKKNDFTNLKKKTVSQLRKLARKMDKFPLKGREISMANKSKLLDAFKSIIDMEE